MTLAAELGAELQRRADREIENGGETWMGKPDRWWEAHTWRCANDHVSRMLLKSEELCSNVCLACHGEVWLTFPEDVEGPLSEVSND